MKQSNIKYSRETTAFIYVRLSRDDELEGESYSISNQKKLLSKIAKEKGYTNTVVFCDDGISGVTMNRPGFNKMIDELKFGKASAVFVKDLSRLGRNYIEVGRLMEEFFPEINVRLIAVSDNVDTNEGDDELAPIRNLFNEWYAKDISKKRRISNRVKGNSGIPLGPAPYGYKKDPDNPHFWIIDLEAALVVRKIFEMAMSDMGVEQIATALNDLKILTPIEYAKNKGIKKPCSRSEQAINNPYYWNKGTIVKILCQQAYCGDVINFKTYSVSYKNKKRHANNPENILIFKDVHEPIIDRETFETIQLKRGQSRKRKTSDGERNMFSGLLVCPECGNNLHFHFNQKNPGIQYFNCPGNNRGKRKVCTSTHYIRVDFLEQVVLGEIRRLTRFACKYEEKFTQVVSDFSKEALKLQIEARQNELKSFLKRDKELDELFERLYEDNVVGKISDDRFKKMSEKYEKEQKDIIEKIIHLQNLIEDLSCKSVTAENFVSAVKKYTRVKKLSARMLKELVDHIEVYHAEKIDGIKTQRIVIHYNCIGSIEIPDELPLPMPDVKIQTRKGVMVGYQTSLVASPDCV